MPNPFAFLPGNNAGFVPDPGIAGPNDYLAADTTFKSLPAALGSVALQGVSPGVPDAGNFNVNGVGIVGEITIGNGTSKAAIFQSTAAGNTSPIVIIKQETTGIDITDLLQLQDNLGNITGQFSGVSGGTIAGGFVGFGFSFIDPNDSANFNVLTLGNDGAASNFFINRHSPVGFGPTNQFSIIFADNGGLPTANLAINNPIAGALEQHFEIFLDGVNTLLTLYSGAGPYFTVTNGALDADSYTVAGIPGTVLATFTTVDGKTVTVTKGIITSVV